MSTAISNESNIGIGWVIHDGAFQILRENLAQEKKWERRTASRVRRFVPEQLRAPKHRAESVSDG